MSRAQIPEGGRPTVRRARTHMLKGNPSDWRKQRMQRVGKRGRGGAGAPLFRVRGAYASLAAPAPSLNAAAERFADGALVIVGDEGDGVAFIATVADTVDAPRLEQLHRLGRGMVVLAIAERIAERLDFHEPRTSARHPLGMDFTAPIDAAVGISGGWSARDRALTMRVVADPDTQASDLRIPGHVHPVRVAERHADVAAAAVELARLGGRPQAVALGTVLDRLGRPASLRETRLDRELMRLPAIPSGELHGVRLARRMTEDLVSCALPTRAGPFRAVGYAPGDGDEPTGCIDAWRSGRVRPSARPRPRRLPAGRCIRIAAVRMPGRAR